MPQVPLSPASRGIASEKAGRNQNTASVDASALRQRDKIDREMGAMPVRSTLLLSLALGWTCHAQEGWWMKEPIRWFQTNLRETDAALDARQLVSQLADYRANVLLIGMGGIAAYYPTRVEFHYPSAYLPAGRDMFGDVLQLAHAQRIRVVGRFDLSKTPKPVFDAHPEWFFRQENGEPVIFQGLYSTCINGGYYRDHAMKILAEALDRYGVDGLFFNMFGNQSSDYAGRYVGLCHCDSCRRLYRARFGKDVPSKPDAEYQKFMADSGREVAASIRKLIKSKRPQAGFFTYILDETDGVMSESNTGVRRPLPLWPYTSSDNVNRARNSRPNQMSVNLCMQFVDYPWRFATVPAGEIALRLWQNIAHGGALAFSVNGTLDLQDRQALEAARPIFRWAAEHEEFYVGQQSAAQVVLMPGQGPAYRGLFRFLSEEHIPFSVTDRPSSSARLVLAAEPSPLLEGYVRAGGRLLITGAKAPFASINVAKRWEGVEGYLRVRDHKLLASLGDVELLMLQGDYVEPDGRTGGALTFVPPSIIGPPEKIHTDMKDTDKTALVLEKLGAGEYAWLPWDAGTMYYRYSLPAHAAVLRDVVDHLLDGRRQLRTNAHPLVEVALMKQGDRTLLHLINLSGHSQTAYFAPIPIPEIDLELEGSYRSARSVRSPAQLAVAAGNGRSRIRLPRLADYELIVLE